MFAHAYTVGDTVRRTHWRAMEQALAHAATAQRKEVLATLAQPAVGAGLVDIMCWLEVRLAEGQSVYPDLRAAHVADWVLRRLARLHEKLKNQPRRASDVAVQHRIRILSKRLRYGVEALQPLLPQRKARRWLQEATALQDNIGSARDNASAVDIVQQLQVDARLVEFLRGVAFGERMHVR
jgi:CHAD domain-containing protein